MKKAVAICLILLTVTALISCGSEDNAQSFSWSDTVSRYEGKDDAGIKREGFVNTTPSEINDPIDALRLAKNEHSLTADEACSVFYDKSADMWMVRFYPASTDDSGYVVGGDVSVYLNGEGMTQLIVAGE